MMPESIFWPALMLDLAGLIICILAILFMLRTRLESPSEHAEQVSPPFGQTYRELLSEQESNPSDDLSPPASPVDMLRPGDGMSLIEKLAPANTRITPYGTEPDEAVSVRAAQQRASGAPGALKRSTSPTDDALITPAYPAVPPPAQVAPSASPAEPFSQPASVQFDTGSELESETVNYTEVEKLADAGMTPEQIAGTLKLPRGEVALVLKVQSMRKGI